MRLRGAPQLRLAEGGEIHRAAAPFYQGHVFAEALEVVPLTLASFSNWSLPSASTGSLISFWICHTRASRSFSSSSFPVSGGLQRSASAPPSCRNTGLRLLPLRRNKAGSPEVPARGETSLYGKMFIL